MYRDETPAATSINRHAWAVKIEEIGDPVGHYGNTIARRSILRLPIRITKANLFIIFASCK